MSNNYAGKFVSAETAVKAVQPGDWVDYGFGAGFPELLDRALAARRDELTDVKIRGGLVIRPRIEVVESDPEQKAFSYYSWHIGDYERKLQTRGLCKFLPMMLRSLPEMYRHHIRVDVAFVPVSRPDADSAVRDLLNDTFGNLNINGARIAVGADRKRLMLALDDEICL